MTSEKAKILEDVEFFKLLQSNKLISPNSFTIQMGILIRTARDEKGISQADLATKSNRRPATISNIENGKSDISILTLISFALILDKPITYFIPEFMLREVVLEVKSPFQHKILEKAISIEEVYGERKLVLNLLDVLIDHFEKEYDKLENNYPDDPEEDEF